MDTKQRTYSDPGQTSPDGAPFVLPPVHDDDEANAGSIQAGGGKTGGGQTKTSPHTQRVMLTHCWFSSQQLVNIFCGVCLDSRSFRRIPIKKSNEKKLNP